MKWNDVDRKTTKNRVRRVASTIGLIKVTNGTRRVRTSNDHVAENRNKPLRQNTNHFIKKLHYI